MPDGPTALPDGAEPDLLGAAGIVPWDWNPTGSMPRSDLALRDAPQQFCATPLTCVFPGPP
jgi:hypothetical protein